MRGRPAAEPRQEPAGPQRPYPLSPLTSAILGALGQSGSDAPSARMGPLSQWQQPGRDWDSGRPREGEEEERRAELGVPP